MENKQKMLLVIDPQYSFLDGGELGVDGSMKIMDDLKQHIENEKYDIIIFTCDWHPHNHISFKEWGKHCVQFTHGASMYNPLYDAAEKNTKNFKVLTKGNLINKEEYSIMDNYESSKKLLRFIDMFNVSQIDVCGIMSSYCVLESLKGLYETKTVPISKLNVMLNYIVEIDKHEALISYCKEKGIKMT